MKRREKYLHIMDRIIRKNTRTIFSLLNKIKKNPESFYMESVCKSLSGRTYDVFFMLKPTDKRTEQQFIYHSRQEKLAIVMQGPIRTENDYTVKTLEYYKEMYPDALVIVSTWNDEDESVIQKIKSCADAIVLSEKPKYSGHLNINFQLVNTYAGIKKARDMGAKYIAKTRTDQCISKPHVFEYMVNLLSSFPSGRKITQKNRMITLSMNYGNMFFPYFMSDFMYLSTTEEMMKMFSVELDQRPRFIMPEQSSRRAYAEAMDAPEVYIMKHYLMKLGYRGDDTIEDYWDAVKQSLICVDIKTLGLDWPKYDSKYPLHSFFGEYFIEDNPEKMKTVNFDFVNWFNLYSGSLVYKPEYEKYADVIFK